MFRKIVEERIGSDYNGITFHKSNICIVQGHRNPCKKCDIMQKMGKAIFTSFMAGQIGTKLVAVNFCRQGIPMSIEISGAKKYEAAKKKAKKVWDKEKKQEKKLSLFGIVTNFFGGKK